MPTSESFQQLSLRFTDPVQHDYEVIRGIMLADETVAERSRLTGVDRETIAEKARRFLEEGMFGLVDRRTTTDKGRHHYPDVVAGYILYLKQLYPPIHYREIVRIVGRKFGYKTNHVTVKAFLERHPIPVQLPLPITGFHQFEDAYRARFTVVRMYYEGWHQQSIASCLGLSRKHVWHILTVFREEGFAGLEDQRTRPATHPEDQLSLPFMKEVLDVQQEHPRAGRFRVRGIVAQRTGQAPSEATIGRAMALNRELHAAPEAWSSDRTDEDPHAGEVKSLLYEPTHRHRYWYIDFRYLVRIGEDRHWVYSLLILEGYSRKVLAGMVTEHQDVVAVLQLLNAALLEYGQPEGMVSDNGAVFTSDAYEGLLQVLGIEVCHIEKGKPWQNLIEAQFKVELRLADAQFERATDLEEIQGRHAAFVELFNTTPHWAHRDRTDGLRTPVEVLSWVRGREVDREVLRRALRHLQVERVVTLRGYVSVQRFYLYAERGLSRQRVSIWLQEGRLQIAYGEVLLAQYACRYERRARRLAAVDTPRLFPTGYAAPQLEFWELDDEQWHKIARRPYERRPIPSIAGLSQVPLPVIGA
ncbi:MAG: transposase [Chloroflexi bacterium]|nr:transposase [Chloroflexota bacterium]